MKALAKFVRFHRDITRRVQLNAAVLAKFVRFRRDITRRVQLFSAVRFIRIERLRVIDLIKTDTCW